MIWCQLLFFRVRFHSIQASSDVWTQPPDLFGSIVVSRLQVGYGIWKSVGCTILLSVGMISSAESSSHWKIQPGLPSALICTLGTGLASFALFAFVFPLVWLMNPITANNLHNPNSTLSLPHMQDLRLSTLSILQARQIKTLFVIHRLSFLFVYGYSLQWSFSMTW